MSKFHYLIISLILLVILVLLIFFQGRERGVIFKKEEPAQTAKKFDRFQIKGGAFTSYNEQGDLILRIKAEEIRHQKRRLGPLIINPVKEIRLKNARIEFHIYPENKNAPRKGSFPLPAMNKFKELVSRQGLGIVSQILLAPIEISVYRKDKAYFNISAKRAKIALRSKRFSFRGNFVLTTLEGEKVIAPKAYLSKNRKALYIPGNYIYITGQGEETGQMAYLYMKQKGGVGVKTPSEIYK